MGIQESHAKLNIINVDAHLDTRQDLEPHSGTPFRQFDNEAKSIFELHQFGIQEEANHLTNYAPLKNGTMSVHAKNDNFEKTIKLQPEWLNIWVLMSMSSGQQISAVAVQSIQVEF